MKYGHSFSKKNKGKCDPGKENSKKKKGRKFSIGTQQTVRGDGTVNLLAKAPEIL
jgi:hypothetical protein